jgi:hypothetical protein
MSEQPGPSSKEQGDHPSESEGLLAAYEPPLASYAGNGTITLDGGTRVECQFEAGQLRDGTVLLLCSLPISAMVHQRLAPSGFTGVSADGTQLLAEHFVETNYLPALPSTPGVYAAFHVRELQAIKSAGAVRHVRFGLTNFNFVGTTPLGGELVLPLTLETPARSISVHVQPLPDMHQIMRRLMTLRSVEVTCEMVAESGPCTKEVEYLQHVCDELAYVLSAGRGTKVQWVYMDTYDDSGACLSRLHREAVTKPYSGLSPLHPGVEHRDATRRFIENAFRIFASTGTPLRLTRAIIDSYVDARLQTDYLEMRGVKATIVIEMLKWISGGDRTRRVDLKAALASLSRRLGLRAKGRVLDALEASRNHLIHQGYFYCQTAPEPRKYAGLSSPWQEYTFLIHFIDVLFLKLLGYDGPYLGWRGSGGPVLRPTVTLDHWTA